MRVVLFLLLTAAIHTSSAYAQGNVKDFHRPGPDAERQAYFAHVRTEINELLIRWKRAWESDDANGIASLYGVEANFYPAGAPPVQLRRAIREHYGSFLPSVADVNVQMIDFGTSGDLAYVTARITYFVRTEAQQVRPQVRIDMLVLRRRSYSNWEIENHLTQENTPPPIP